MYFIYLYDLYIYYIFILFIYHKSKTYINLRYEIYILDLYINLKLMVTGSEYFMVFIFLPCVPYYPSGNKT